MTRPLDVDRVLEDWLAEGPSRLPERVVDATIGQLDDIRQRKPFWLPGSQRMHRLIMSATGVAATAVLAVVALAALNLGSLVGGPTGVPFTSERHAYTVVLPDDSWTVEERAGSWAFTGAFFDANSGAGVDYFEDLDSRGEPTLYVYLASQEIPDGTTFDQWVASHDAATRLEVPCFELVGRFETPLVDGEPARVGAHRCADYSAGIPWTTVQTMVVHAGRGYAIYVWPAPIPGDGPAGTAERPLSELQAQAADWLARFSFND